MSDRKKILWLTSWYPNLNDPFDGDFIQRHAKAAAIHHDVHVIFVTSTSLAEARSEIFSNTLGLTEQVIYFREPSGFFRNLRKQRTWIRHYQQAIDDYVEKHGLPSAVHVHVPWKAGLLAVWMKRKYGTEFIISEHWGIYNTAVAHSFYSSTPVIKGLTKRIFEEANVVVTVSNHLARGIGEAVGRSADVILPNVVDTAIFHKREAKYSMFTFIHISNMVPLKNVEDILAAFHTLVKDLKTNECQLVLAGNRDDAYVKKAEALGLLNSSVFFRGEIKYTEVAEEMGRAHCLVMFSDSETFSCVTAEALCSGLPVIASAVGALPELVNQSNGILVTAGDRAALTEAMRNMMEKYNNFDPDQISRAASARYGYSEVSEQFSRLYRDMTGRKEAPHSTSA